MGIAITVGFSIYRYSITFGKKVRSEIEGRETHTLPKPRASVKIGFRS